MSADAYVRFHGSHDLLPITALQTTDRQCRSVAAVGEHYYVRVVDSGLRNTGERVCLGCGVLTISEDNAIHLTGWGRA